MPRIVFGAVVAGVIASASGCGAMAAGMAGPFPPEPYCAVKMDVEAVQESFSEGSCQGFGLGLFLLADMPISALVGTLNLPNVYLMRYLCEKHQLIHESIPEASDQKVNAEDQDLKEKALDQ
jgi:hypothetical protein